MQRLEFLGDSVLDILITWYLYQSHADVDPGELTDLRSASVNNENFAQVAVRHNFEKHLQYCSSVLQSQITEYVRSFNRPEIDTRDLQHMKGPKVRCHIGLFFMGGQTKHLLHTTLSIVLFIICLSLFVSSYWRTEEPEQIDLLAPA